MERKSILYLIITLLSLHVCFGQKITYHNKDGKKVTKSEATYYRQVEETKKGLWKIDEYYMDGSIANSGYSSKKNGSVKQGEWIWYYENGQIKNDVVFMIDKENTTLIVKSFYNNGNLFRDSRYITQNQKVDYKLLSGNCFDERGDKITEIPFMRTATFPGGAEMLKKYIKSNVRYPPNAFKNKEQGRVFVSYFLDKKGNVKKTRIARSVSFFLDKEALRVVNNMPKWTPEIQYGELVERRYTIPISFGLQ